MDNEKMLQAFVDIDNASEVAKATLNTVIADNCFDNERLGWVLVGVVEQIEKIEKAAEAIDWGMEQKGGDCAV